MKRKFSLFVLLASFVCFSFGQEIEDKPEVLQCPIIGASFGYVIPKGNLGEMFSPFLQVGFNGTYKTKTNWLFQFDGNFNFGSDNLKSEARSEILKDLHGTSGVIIGTESIEKGTVFPENIDAGILAYNRGGNLSLKAGKIFPVFKKNPNSGIFVMGGVGGFQNKIIYEAVFNAIDQLSDDYAKGYDRKIRGFQLTELVGYWFMNNTSHYFNFFIGVEFGQSWSKSARKYQFDLRGKDDKTYFDQTYSLKVGWMFPLGSRKASGFYYN